MKALEDLLKAWVGMTLACLIGFPITIIIGYMIIVPIEFVCNMFGLHIELLWASDPNRLIDVPLIVGTIVLVGVGSIPEINEALKAIFGRRKPF
jgi:hypothetical protein